jgi:hypothetical protein
MLLLGAVAALGASLPRNSVRGEYVEARTADVYTGPCFANGEVNQVGDLAVLGWNIQKGSWEGVKLDGLSVLGVLKAGNTLGGMAEGVYPVKSVLVIDERATPEQRLALRSFARRMGGDLLQDVVRVDYQPIEFEVQDENIHAAVTNVRAGKLVQVATRSLADGDQICHNEEAFYPPLTKLDHAMPAYTVAHRFNGEGLNTKWSSPGKRGSFVGTFEVTE